MQVVIKLAEADVSVSALSALRFGIAAMCFLPAAGRGLRMPQLRATALELGVWLFGEASSFCSNFQFCLQCLTAVLHLLHEVYTPSYLAAVVTQWQWPPAILLLDCITSTFSV